MKLRRVIPFRAGSIWFMVVEFWFFSSGDSPEAIRFLPGYRGDGEQISGRPPVFPVWGRVKSA
jgi:hypothetical protein